jgi:hypothetical protein
MSTPHELTGRYWVGCSNCHQLYTELGQARKKLREVEATKAGDPRFHELLAVLASMHGAKGADYGTEDDPLANCHESAEFGVEPWRYLLARVGEKVRRLKVYARTGRLANEGVEDSLLDVAACSLLTLILWREARSV